MKAGRIRICSHNQDRKRLFVESLEDRRMLASMRDAGVNATGIAQVNAHQYSSAIIADESFQNTLDGLVHSESAPADAQVITDLAGLSQIQAGGVYVLQGDFTFAQPLDVPSNVEIYVDGSIYLEGTHTTTGIHDPGAENSNNASAIFRVHNSDNVKLIGVNNALLNSSPNLITTSPHSSGIVITGNASNVHVEGFEMSHVWEGVVAHFGTEDVTIKHNYIHDTLKRAVWLLGIDNAKVVHNFLQNPGADGIDFDAYTADSTAYENVVVGAGRWAGFVEEGANNNYLVRGAAIMADMANPNAGFQMGWADNGTSSFFVANNPGLLTRDNYFIDNVSFRPTGFNDGGDYFSKFNNGKGQTYFWANRGFGFNQSESAPGLMDVAEWLDSVPTAGGANNLVDGQQLLADLAAEYEHVSTGIDAGPGTVLVLPQHTYALQPTLSSTTTTSSLVFDWQMIDGPDEVSFTDSTALFPTVAFRQPGSYMLEVSVRDSGYVVTDTVVVEVNAPTTSVLTTVVDEFETYAPGAAPPTNNPWSIKSDAVNTSQRELMTVTAGIGVDGGQALVLDTAAALREYNGVHQSGVTGSGVVGDQLVLRADVRIGINGSPLQSGTDGTNQPAIGLRVSESPVWSSTADVDFMLARRTDGVWGFRLPASPWIEGWNSNALLGFSGNSGGAELGDWTTLEVVLTDNGVTYDASFRVLDQSGAVQYTSTYDWATPFASGATLFGGFTTGWNPSATATVETLAKIDTFQIDNFEFTGDSVGVVPTAPGDFDVDEDYDIDDLNELVAVISDGVYDIYYDISGDGLLDSGDVSEWLARAGSANLPGGGNYLFGDANLDAIVDVTDFNIWLTQKTLNGAAWSGADFDANGVTDDADFQIWNTSRFQSAAMVQVAATVRGPMDVNADGEVTPLDALIVVNALNSAANDSVESRIGHSLDVSGDGRLANIDATLVINQLNAIRSSSNHSLRVVDFAFETDDEEE